MTALLYIIAVHDNKDYKRLVRYVSWDNYRFAGYYLSAPRATNSNTMDVNHDTLQSPFFMWNYAFPGWDGATSGWERHRIKFCAINCLHI